MAWLAVFITVLASTGNNIGKALQKDATRGLPRFSLEPQILLQYVRSRQWLGGLAADLAGALLMIAAFALAPVSVVQPVSGIGLVTLAVFSHFYLQERLQLAEWVAVVLAAAGTIGLGATGEEAATKQAIRPSRLVGVLACLSVALGAASLVRLRAQSRRRSGSGQKVSTGASIYGLQAGACFGLSAAACRTGFLLAQQTSLVWVPLGLAASVALTSAGFVLQTCGLKDGNTVIVCTCAAVSSMVTGVAVGLLALGESMPASLAGRTLRLLSWALIGLGVAGLANGSGSFTGRLRPLYALVPRQLLPLLPTSMALRLRPASQKPLVLPTSVPPAAHQPLKRTESQRIVSSHTAK